MTPRKETPRAVQGLMQQVYQSLSRPSNYKPPPSPREIETMRVAAATRSKRCAGNKRARAARKANR